MLPKILVAGRALAARIPSVTYRFNHESICDFRLRHLVERFFNRRFDAVGLVSPDAGDCYLEVRRKENLGVPAALVAECFNLLGRRNQRIFFGLRRRLAGDFTFGFRNFSRFSFDFDYRRRFVAFGDSGVLELAFRVNRRVGAAAINVCAGDNVVARVIETNVQSGAISFTSSFTAASLATLICSAILVTSLLFLQNYFVLPVHYTK